MKPVDVLKKARELVARPGGWCQGDVFGGDACCALGATSSVVSDDGDDGPASDAEDILRKAIGTNRLADWNDAPGRTQAEVVAAFDKAIALAEEEQ